MTAETRQSNAAVPSLRRALAGWRPPMNRREFWLTQVLVVLIAIGHVAIELLTPGGDHEALYLLPVSLLVVPIVYAALYFGLRGAVQTTLWCALLSVPNVFVIHHGMERLGEIIQLLGLSVSALFVGWWVDRERAARHEAEARELARRTSEEKYRAIFDTVDEPIALIDASGIVVEANAAAADLFRSRVTDVRGRRLPEPIRASLATMLDARRSRSRGRSPVRFLYGSSWIEAHGTRIVDPAGQERTQLVLRDVTADHERAQGLEGIARQALAAREAEQRRIAREIHDGPVQSLILLVRELDAMASEHRDSVDAAKARAVAVDVTDQLRRVSRDLRPSILDDLGLPSALGALAHQFGDRTGIRTRFVLTGTPERLDPEVELMLLRVSEEALRNIERHAGARTARVKLAFSSRVVALTIADDGRGMVSVPSASTLMASSRLGIIGMRERARLAGGELSLRSPRSGGLTVKVVLPVALAHRTSSETAQAVGAANGVGAAPGSTSDVPVAEHRA